MRGAKAQARLRELRIVVPDSRLASVRRHVAAQVARLMPGSEDEALSWIEAVSSSTCLIGKRTMKHGDVVIVAAAGDYGKPDRRSSFRRTRPEIHASVVICQVTSESGGAPSFRVTVDPSKKNGLRATLTDHGR